MAWAIRDIPLEPAGAFRAYRTRRCFMPGTASLILVSVIRMRTLHLPISQMHNVLGGELPRKSKADLK